jgi:hypothetical protein
MSAKAQKLAAELVDELRKTPGPDYILVEGFDDDGWSVLTMKESSTETTEEDNVYIRVRAREWGLTKDIIGHDQPVYTPSVIQLVTEAAASGSAPAPFVSADHWARITQLCTKRGTRVEFWTTAHGTVPSDVDFASDDLVSAIEPDLYYPLLSSQ